MRNYSITNFDMFYILSNCNYLASIANRGLFKDRLEQALARCGRADQSLALMFVDLDDFKLVNDTQGHEVGDLLLKEIADRLTRCMRQSDTVARLGGDEFTVILEGIEHTQAAALVAESFWRRLQAKWDEMAAAEARLEYEHCDDAELVVVAFGALGRFARFAVQQLRAEGLRVGFARPVTLWPFPSEALAQVTAQAKRIAVLEQNAGQMIDDVRLSILGRAPVVPIGGISSDEAGFGLGPLLDPERIRDRVAAAHAGEEVVT